MLALAGAALTPAVTSAQECKLRSASGPAPRLVELYTSEGCSSCPPADRWLSTLGAQGDAVTVGFHVNYWDYIGWRDRFASDATTQRQKSHREAWGARQIYTPQVVVDGRDWPTWPRGLPPPERRPAPLQLEMERSGQRVVVRAGPAQGLASGALLSGWWAALEDGHSSRVTAGENSGERLRHDSVVREYRSVSPWLAAQGAELVLQLPAADPRHPQRVVFVVPDTTPQRRPLQVLALRCP